MTEKKLPDFAMSEEIDQAHSEAAKKVKPKCETCRFDCEHEDDGTDYPNMPPDYCIDGSLWQSTENVKPKYEHTAAELKAAIKWWYNLPSHTKVVIWDDWGAALSRPEGADE